METVAAIVILAIAVPPMVWALREGHTQRVNPVMASTARWLLTEKLDDIIADRHSTTRGWAYLIPGNYTAESPVTDFDGFDRSVTLTEYLKANQILSPQIVRDRAIAASFQAAMKGRPLLAAHDEETAEKE